MRCSRRSKFLSGVIAGGAAVIALSSPVLAEEIDAKKVFATNCSWCHGDYGRKAGKGPKLAGTTMNEKQLYDRIFNGAPGGAMPAYKKTLSEEKIQALVTYIKNLPAE
jgi:mono/diheme cytochrome c family protein